MIVIYALVRVATGVDLFEWVLTCHGGGHGSFRSEWKEEEEEVTAGAAFWRQEKE